MRKSRKRPIIGTCLPLRTSFAPLCSLTSKHRHLSLSILTRMLCSQTLMNPSSSTIFRAATTLTTKTIQTTFQCCRQEMRVQRVMSPRTSRSLYLTFQCLACRCKTRVTQTDPSVVTDSGTSHTNSPLRSEKLPPAKECSRFSRAMLMKMNDQRGKSKQVKTIQSILESMNKHTFTSEIKNLND